MSGAVSSASKSDSELLREVSDLIFDHHLHYKVSPGQILPHLFLGDSHDAHQISDLKRLGITHVYNCASMDVQTGPQYYEPHSIAYAEFPAEDAEGYNVLPLLDSAHSFIENALAEGGKCLVHCLMGVNRSGAVVVSYCCKTQDWKLLEAIKTVKKRRQVLLTNTSFQAQLITWARKKSLL